LSSLFRYVQTIERVSFEKSSSMHLLLAAAVPITFGLTSVGIEYTTGNKTKLSDALPVLGSLCITLALHALLVAPYGFELRILATTPWLIIMVASALVICLQYNALSLLLSVLACHVTADLVKTIVWQMPLQPHAIALLILLAVVISFHQADDNMQPDDAAGSPLLHRLIMILGLVAVFSAASYSRPVSSVAPAAPATAIVQVSKAMLNRTKVASMIETRPLPILIPLVTHWLATVPEDWPFVLWTSQASRDQLLSSATVSRAVHAGRLNLTLLPDWVDVSSGEALSRFLTKPWFWYAHDSEAEWMLFFQADAILCAASEQTVDDWLGYDFVGAPCPWSTHDEHHGGNGGLSMRKISTMQRITSDRRPEIVRQDNTPSSMQMYHGTPHEAEDWWAMSRIEMLVPEARWPDNRSQNTFSISWGGQDSMRPLGVHRGSGPGLELWQYERAYDFQRLISYCPELLMIRDYATNRIPH
jgi:hypothetical protein